MIAGSTCIMDHSKKIVTHIPLVEIWSPRGPLVAKRIRYLDASDTATALARGKMLSPTRLAVADLGVPLHWLDPVEIPTFWENEARGRIVDPSAARFRLDEYPGEYCFTVSEWREPESSSPIYVFERHH